MRFFLNIAYGKNKLIEIWDIASLAPPDYPIPRSLFLSGKNVNLDCCFWKILCSNQLTFVYTHWKFAY